jgi:hypothetical protein
MKKSIIFAALLLSACTPPLMSDPNQRKAAPDTTTTKSVVVPAPVQEFNDMTLEGEFNDDEIGQEHIYEEIPEPSEEIM